MRSVDKLSGVGVFVAVGWAIATIVAMTWGELFSWPDFVHTNYGFPLTFATHITDTFIGPVDKWTVDQSALAADLSFWAAGLVLIFVGFVALVRRAAATLKAPAA